MAKLQCFVFLGVLAVFSVASAAISEEDKNAIKAEMLPVLAECGKEHGVTEKDVKEAKESNNVDAINPCFIACFMKKRKIIDDEGKYAPEVAKSEHAKYIHDAELVAKLDEISDNCASVNDQAVSDGAKGCERAKLLTACLTEHKDILTEIFKD
uniref:Odorant-binding protein 6 n=1 Tax=Ectropis obliqua TaxID=248899 RepID=A0A1L2BL92_ECTOB|nr:odorant-binding protein 6 [Ectropis obliqua]